MTEIQFDEIREGDHIEVEYADQTKVSFVAARKGWDATAWSSPGGEFQITPPGTPNQLGGRTIRLLHRPGPKLPTEPGSVILANNGAVLIYNGCEWDNPKTGGLFYSDELTGWTLAAIVPLPDLDKHQLRVRTWEADEDGKRFAHCSCGGWEKWVAEGNDDRPSFADHLADAWGFTGSRP